MRLPNSSTLSSKILHRKFHRNWAIRKAFVTVLCTMFFLCVFDLAINVLFPYPANPLAVHPKQIQVYFDYGRSVEGKLSHMLGPSDDKSAAIAQAGWLDPEQWQHLNLPTRRKPGDDLLMAVYGNSFSEQVAAAVESLDPKITIRFIGGPAAPPNHSYAAYTLDRGAHQADIVVLGILASSVKALRTLNGMTWQFEAPAPYSYPRYMLQDGKLKAIMPKVGTLAQLRAAFYDPPHWNDYIKQLQEHDEFYNSFLFHHNLLDRSAIIRMMRRAFAQRYQAMQTSQAYSKTTGFNAEVEVPLLQAITTEFAAAVRKDGKLPIVLLFNDQGYADHLFQALKSTLESNSIPYISSHTIAPATDIRNFIPDGHFVKSVNQKIGQAMLSLINQHFDR